MKDGPADLDTEPDGGIVARVPRGRRHRESTTVGELPPTLWMSRLDKILMQRRHAVNQWPSSATKRLFFNIAGLGFDAQRPVIE